MKNSGEETKFVICYNGDNHFAAGHDLPTVEK